MSTLLDSLRNQLKAPQAAPVVGQTEQAQNVLRAKLGQAPATGDSGPRRSVIQEQGAAQTAQTALREGQQQGILQAKELEQREERQELETKTQFQSIQDNIEQSREQFAMQASNIMNDLRQAGQKLDSQKDTMKLEQLGFMLRFQDKNYVTELENQARLQMLDNDVKFKEAALKSALQDKMSLFQNDQQFRQFANMNRRQFTEALAQMDINYAMQVAEQEMSAAKSKALFSGVGGLMQAGLNYAATAPKKPAVDNTLPTMAEVNK
jgi:hypothetical protein